MKQKNCEQVKHTHLLEWAGIETRQDMKSKRATKGHSLAGRGEGRDRLAHREKVSERGILTSWRGQRLRQGKHEERAI